MANRNQQYAEQYAEYAMEQMQLYGIPASVTLAQGILESANGQSQLAKKENNHFGIKASKSWLDSGGRYGLYTDDKPNEKFCSYDSVGDSYTHHSQFLKNNSRYAACFRLAADDYRGWAQGLDKAGYATAGSYAPALISIIERNDLQKYDRMVMERMRAEGFAPGQATANGADNNMSSSQTISTDYSFPLKREEFMLVTSPFGMRNDPMNPGKDQMHKGIDIRCRNEALLATENGGKVVATNENANTPGSKSVTIEYQRQDGSKTQVSYHHLSSISVKQGDSVNAGTQIGVSGNTGTRTTGEHLHFSVRQIVRDGTSRDIDPAAYLAEIAQKGKFSQILMHNGTDLLAKYKADNPPTVGNDNVVNTSLAPDEWMKKLLSSEDSGVGLSGMSNDPIMDMVITLFTSLMALAVKIDNKTQTEALQAATEAAMNRCIDLTSLMPSLKECNLIIRENDTPVLQYNNGNDSRKVALSTADMNRMSVALNDSSLSDDDKKRRLANVVNGIIVSDGLAKGYDRGISEQSMSETISR